MYRGSRITLFTVSPPPPTISAPSEPIFEILVYFWACSPKEPVYKNFGVMTSSMASQCQIMWLLQSFYEYSSVNLPYFRNYLSQRLRFGLKMLCNDFVTSLHHQWWRHKSYYSVFIAKKTIVMLFQAKKIPKMAYDGT